VLARVPGTDRGAGVITSSQQCLQLKVETIGSPDISGTAEGFIGSSNVCTSG